MQATSKYIFIVLTSYVLSSVMAIGPAPFKHILFSVLFFSIIYLFSRDERKFPKPELNKRVALYIVIGLLVHMAVSGFLIYVLPKPIEEQKVKILAKSYGFVGILLSCVMAPLTEEYIFRYLPQNKSSIVASIVLFGLLHIQKSTDLYTAFYPAIITTVNAITYHYFYRKTNNLYVSIGIHAISNAIVLGLL